ncbi:MAG: hypothetical protein ACKVS6_07075 [Planctomycetota bacterium]
MSLQFIRVYSSIVYIIFISLAMSRAGFAQGLPPNQGGSWAGPFTLGIIKHPLQPPLPAYDFLFTDSHGLDHYLQNRELSHAALIPPGEFGQPQSIYRSIDHLEFAGGVYE